MPMNLGGYAGGNMADPRLRTQSPLGQGGIAGGAMTGGNMAPGARPPSGPGPGQGGTTGGNMSGPGKPFDERTARRRALMRLLGSNPNQPQAPAPSAGMTVGFQPRQNLGGRGTAPQSGYLLNR